MFHMKIVNMNFTAPLMNTIVIVLVMSAKMYLLECCWNMHVDEMLLLH